MQIAGEWRETPTTVPRPYLRAHVEAQNGTWVECIFLIDTGADCTVISADVARQMRRPTTPALRQLGGIGGPVETLEVWTTLRLTGVDGNRFHIAGASATPTDAAIGESILGYDVLHLFSMIIDKPGNTVCLVRPPHTYTIQGS
jgi:predicted aspartyl protease